MRNALIGLVLALTAGLPVAYAEDIDGRSAIDAVTLYLDRAEITRTVAFQATRGRHRVLVSGLPVTVVRDSLQVVPGEATAGLSIGAVSLVELPQAALASDAARLLAAQIDELQVQKRQAEDAIRAQQMTLSVIDRLAADTGDGIAREMDSGVPNTLAWREALDALKTETLIALTEISKAEVLRDGLADEIAAKRRELELLDNGATSILAAAIDIQADDTLEGDLALIYQTTGGQWRPVYEARLSTEDGQLQISQHAVVQQKTGEDWRQVALKLSTSRPVFRGLPDLEPWVIDEIPAPAPLADAVGASRSLRSFAAESEAMPATRAKAEVQTEGLSTTLVVPGLVTVPSDSSDHQLLVDQLDQPVELKRRAIPRIEPRAFVSAEFTFEGATAWPAGSMRLFRDGAFIGQVRQDLLMPGGEARLDFGHDDQIEITYRLDDDGRSSAGIITDYRRIERSYLMRVINHRDSDVGLVLIDQMPVPRDERIEVERTGAPKPTTVDYRGRKGVMAWDLDLKAGASKAVRFGYAVTHPSEMEINLY